MSDREAFERERLVALGDVGVGMNPLKCPTCGAVMELYLVGKVNPVYVALCVSVTVPHPTWICTPTIQIDK